VINVTRSSLPPFEEYCNEIKELWDSRRLTNMGVKHQKLEDELKKCLDTPHVTLFTNGHLALENALAVFNFPSGSEVITTPFTFASTTHAITRSGLTPVFCDIDPVNYTLDPSKIEALITERTVAILPVHVYGNICDVDGIQRIADKYGLKVIYDAAHAFGVTYRGSSAANFGDLVMFSFHATKVFNTVEGGAVCCSDEFFVRTLDDLKNFGIHGEDEIAFAGGNAKMSEFQAAMGICNLRHLDNEIAKRGKLVKRYRELLNGVDGIVLPPVQPDVKPNYAYFPVVFDGYRYTRDEIFERLVSNGIIPRKYFYPLTNSFACYKQIPTAGEEKTPLAAHIARNILCLPLYPDLALHDLDRICEIVLN